MISKKRLKPGRRYVYDDSNPGSLVIFKERRKLIDPDYDNEYYTINPNKMITKFVFLPEFEDEDGEREEIILDEEDLYNELKCIRGYKLRLKKRKHRRKAKKKLKSRKRRAS